MQTHPVGCWRRYEVASEEPAAKPTPAEAGNQDPCCQRDQASSAEMPALAASLPRARLLKGATVPFAHGHGIMETAERCSRQRSRRGAKHGCRAGEMQPGSAPPMPVWPAASRRPSWELGGWPESRACEPHRCYGYWFRRETYRSTADHWRRRVCNRLGPNCAGRCGHERRRLREVGRSRRSDLHRPRAPKRRGGRRGVCVTVAHIDRSRYGRAPKTTT